MYMIVDRYAEVAPSKLDCKYLFVLYRTNIRTPGREPDSPLPPINERLAYLRPSRELLEFYREKIAQFDSEHEELLQMLEKYRGITEDQVRTQRIMVCEVALSGCPNWILLHCPPSISYSGRYDSVRERLLSCKTLWVTCRSICFKRESSLCDCMQKMTD